jgi:hypothetical protein
MPRTSGVPGQNVDCNDNGAGNRAMAVAGIFPKDWYSWTDRTVTTPDESSSWSTSGLTPIGTGDAGYLVVTAEGNVASAIIQIAIVLFDERGNAIGLINGNVTLSASTTNANGNFFAAGDSADHSLIVVDVSLVAGYSAVVLGLGGCTSVSIHSRVF